MASDDVKYDKLLKIQTAGRDTGSTDQYRYPYEPTPYSVLNRLAESGYITRENTLLDFGAGKGRVGFYLSHHTGCSSVGIEYDKKIYEAAQANRKKAPSGKKTTFVLGDARQYKIPRNADRCFFFNPFSVEVLASVLEHIFQSAQAHPRKLLLFFYYPEEEYLAYLRAIHGVKQLDSIDCRDLFPDDNPREQIAVFELIKP